MLRRSFKPDKCKLTLKLAIPRIKLMKNKREAQYKQLKRELAQLLESGKDQMARIRVEHVVMEEKTMAAYELLEIYCELIVARMPIIESQKNCPLDLNETIASVVFASARCEEIPELKDVTKHFTAKYGKYFISSAIELRPSCGVDLLLVEKLSAKPPDGPTKLKILTAIAEEHNIKWDPESFGAKESKIYDDLLNGPNTLSDATRFSTGPPTTQASTSHYEQRPPSVQVPNPNVQDPKHIAKTENQGMEFRNPPNRNEGDFSSPRQHGNMEFKDDADAARAAVESAERARMAAQAAAELSIQHYAVESAHSMRDEETRKYTDSASQDAHVARHPDNISRKSRNYEQTEQHNGIGETENDFSNFVGNDDKSTHGSSKSTAASFDEKPSVNNQTPEAYSQRNLFVGRQMEHFDEASMKQNSGNETHFVNEFHGIKNPPNVDHHGVRDLEQSSYSSPHSISNTFVDDCDVVSNLDGKRSGNGKRNSCERMQFVNELHDRKNSESSSSSTFCDDLDVLSNLNHPNSRNHPVGNPFALNDKGNLQRSTIETTDTYDNDSTVFDDYGSYNDEYNFDLEEERKVHEYNMKFLSPFMRSPTHSCPCSNSWSTEQKVESLEVPFSQSCISSEQQSNPLFFESSTSSVVPSHVNDSPPTFDNYGPSSESEVDIDKFDRNNNRSISGHKRNMDQDTELYNDSSMEERKELNFGNLTGGGGLRNKGYRHPPYSETPRGEALSDGEEENDKSSEMKKSSPPLVLEDSVSCRWNDQEPCSREGRDEASRKLSKRTSVIRFDSSDDDFEERPKYTFSSTPDQCNRIPNIEENKRSTSRVPVPYFDSDSDSDEYLPKTSAKDLSSIDEAPPKFQLQRRNSDHSQLASQATSTSVSERKTSSSDGTLKSPEKDQPCTSSLQIVSSGSAKSSKAQTSIGERSTHVHPKLPDIDTLTEHLNSLRQNRQ